MKKSREVKSKDGKFIVSEPNYQWSCHICGPHPDSSAMWCGAGCGSDYIEMTKVEDDS